MFGLFCPARPQFEFHWWICLLEWRESVPLTKLPPLPTMVERFWPRFGHVCDSWPKLGACLTVCMLVNDRFDWSSETRHLAPVAVRDWNSNGYLAESGSQVTYYHQLTVSNFISSYSARVLNIWSPSVCLSRCLSVFRVVITCIWLWFIHSFM